MINPFSVTNDLLSLLDADETIKSYVGDRIFPLVAPDNTEGDFIIYQRDGTKESETKQGISDVTAIVYYDVISLDYLRSQEIAMAIKKCLEGRYDGDFSEIKLEDSTEDFVDRKYIQILQFSIK
jgi:hypothetical protein